METEDVPMVTGKKYSKILIWDKYKFNKLMFNFLGFLIGLALFIMFIGCFLYFNYRMAVKRK